MRILCICILALSTAFVLCADINERARSWSGQCFGTRQYPSIEELKSIPLRELLETRPSKIAGAEKSHFEDLFARHGDVSDLMPEVYPNHDDFVQKWVDLWGATNMGPKAKRLHHAIVSHLQNKLGISEDGIKEIKQRHDCAQAVIGALKSRHKRRTSTNPIDMAQRIREIELQRRYSQERRAGTRGTTYGFTLFMEMLNANHIPTDLPAVELETATRRLRDALGDVQRTTLHFRQYLTCRNKKEAEIKTAMLNRRAYNYGLLREKVNEKQKAVDKIRRSRRKPKESGQNQHKAQDERQSDQARLLGQSRWWAV